MWLQLVKQVKGFIVYTTAIMIVFLSNQARYLPGVK